VGALNQGGAEKQLVYMARALLSANVDVRVYSLTRNEFYEPVLRGMGVPLYWIGRIRNPLVRLTVLAVMLCRFRPHIIQATHFFANLYVTLAARFCGAMPIGSIRNDVLHELQANGHWGPWLLRLPRSLLANSEVARRNAEASGVAASSVHVLGNVIDLSEFDAASSLLPVTLAGSGVATVIAVGRLVEAKRLDRFLEALSVARQQVGQLQGIIAGDGPARPSLEAKARQLGLLPGHVQFLGRRDDIPALLRQAQMLVLSSDHEGFPNVLLEAMSARLPVITTPAGDAERLVRDGVSGYLVPFNDVPAMAARIAHLATSADIRSQMGQAGRSIVEQHYSYVTLADRLLSVYKRIAEQQNHPKIQHVLPCPQP
jgi:glycosyltransferase involved in cell wall biosynthesis